MIEQLATILWIEVSIILIILGIYIFLPAIVAIAYKKFTIWILLSTIFLRRTPLPWIILFLNCLEDNDEILDLLDEILENQNKILNNLKN